MKNKILIFFTCFWIFSIKAFPQNIALRLESDFGSFMMQDLKDFQKSLIPMIGVNVESLSKFPPYFGFGGSLLYYQKSTFGVGITGDYFSTGARNYYEDYSGSYKLDMLTTCYDVGAIIDFRTGQYGALSTWLDISGGYKFSKMTISEYIFITNPVSSVSNDLESGSVWIRPGLRLDYGILKFISVGAFIGGELNIKSKLHLENDHEAVLMNINREEVNIDWSGFRAALQISFHF